MSDANEVIRLPPERFDEAVEALCDAFRDYPVMRYVLKDAGDDYFTHLTHLVGYFTASRFARGWPVLGVEREGRVVAVANINPPHSVPAPPELIQRYEEMCRVLGDKAIQRFHAFADACGPLEPDEPHYYLGMIGVRREAQGLGCARQLLDELHRLSANDPASSGVVLTTETQENLPFYEKFGYRVLGEARAEELRTWTLFRRDRDLARTGNRPEPDSSTTP